MTIKQLAVYAAIALGLLTPVLAAAQTPSVTSAVNADVSATAGAPGASASMSASAKFTATETKAKGRGDAEVDRRITALTDLNTRIQAMQKVTDTFKQNIASAIQAQLTEFASLKAKIDADADSATLKADLKSITDSYRVFALVMPQARIAAAADRSVTLVSMMSTLGAKLQARIQAVQQGGADVTALTAALTDMAAKLQDAQTQASAAVTASAPLNPDNGDKTVMASNTAALKVARTAIQAAHADLVQARKDVDTILKGLKAAEVSANASSTTQVKTQ